MKIIEVLNMIAKGEIEKGTKFILGDNLYIFNGDRFKAGNFYLGGRIFLNARDLNREVDLILPKPKKYLIKLTIKGINDENTYLNLNRKRNTLFLSDNYEGQYYQRKFTTQEMQDIQLVRELLEDMEGKYELIGVDDNEID